MSEEEEEDTEPYIETPMEEPSVEEEEMVEVETEPYIETPMEEPSVVEEEEMVEMETESYIETPMEEPSVVEEEEMVEVGTESCIETPIEELSIESPAVLSDVTPDSPIAVEPTEESEESIPEESIPEESIPEEISTLTRSPTISMFDETPSIRDEDAVSLYAPSIVPTIPDDLEYAVSLPLPPSVAETESLLSSPRTEVPPSPSPSPSTPSTITTPLIVEDVPPESTEAPVSSVSESRLSFEASSSSPPPSPVIEPPSIPSLLTTVSSTTTESESTPTPSSVSSTSSESVSVPSQTPPPSSLLARSVPSRSDGYDYSFLMPSPSMHSSVPIPEGADKSFETSFLRPSFSMSDVPSEEVATVPPKSEVSTISTPTMESTGTLSVSRDVTVSLARSPSSVSTISSLSMNSSVFYPRSIYDEEEEEEDSKFLPSPATMPTLMSTRRSITPSSDRTASPPTVPTLLSTREVTVVSEISLP
jgi:hypothetical protein